MVCWRFGVFWGVSMDIIIYNMIFNFAKISHRKFIFFG